MGMADLKKTTSKQSKLKKIDIEDFIDDADNYASGLPSLLFDVRHQPDNEKAHKLKELADNQSRRKNATFSLNENTIKELETLVKNKDLHKSKLVRVLIQYFAYLNEKERAAILRLFAKQENK